MSRTNWRYGPNGSQNVETVGRAYWHGAKSMVSVVKHITSGGWGCGHFLGLKFQVMPVPVATVMALDRAIRCGNDTSESVYDNRGLLFI